MTRLLKLVTVIFAIISIASAQFVDTLNTPLGPVTQNANVLVSWTLLPGVDATGKTGDLSAMDSATKNVIPIDPAVQLAPKTYTWSVKVPPGTYVLGLNDGSGLKQSGEVVVKAPVGGSALPPPGPGASPAPAPAPAPGTSKAPGTAAGSPPSTTGAAGGAGGSTPSDGGSSSSNPPSISTPAPSSASFIFSGYEVVLSLLCVAIAMVQF
jgi:hypothetical protein